MVLLNNPIFLCIFTFWERETLPIMTYLTFKKLHYLFLAVLGLCCCVGASCCGEWGLLSSCGVLASHCGGFSFCGAQALGHMGFSSCGVWARDLFNF